jgi:hypothetical protein
MQEHSQMESTALRHPDLKIWLPGDILRPCAGCFVCFTGFLAKFEKFSNGINDFAAATSTKLKVNRYGFGLSPSGCASNQRLRVW